MTAKIVELKQPIQLELPLIWWQDPDLWQERRTAQDYVIPRPVEQWALANIHVQAKAAKGAYRTVLSVLEREVDDAMLMFKKMRSGYPELHYAQQSATYLKMPLFQVRSILEDIAYVKRSASILELAGIDDTQAEAA